MKMTLVLMMMKTLTTSKLDLLSKRFLLPRLAWCVAIKAVFLFSPDLPGICQANLNLLFVDCIDSKMVQSL